MEVENCIFKTPEYTALSGMLESYDMKEASSKEMTEEEQKELQNALNVFFMKLDKKSKQDASESKNTISTAFNLLIRQIEISKNKAEKNENNDKLFQKLKEGLSLPEDIDEENILEYLESLIEEKSNENEIQIKLNEALKDAALKKEVLEEKNSIILNLREIISQLTGKPFQEDGYGTIVIPEGGDIDEIKSDILSPKQNNNTKAYEEKIRKLKSKIEKMEESIENICEERDKLALQNEDLQSEIEKLKLQAKYSSIKLQNSSQMNVSEIDSQCEEKDASKVLEMTYSELENSFGEVSMYKEQVNKLIMTITRSMELNSLMDKKFKELFLEKESLQNQLNIVSEELHNANAGINDQNSASNGMELLDSFYSLSQILPEETGVLVQDKLKDESVPYKERISSSLEIINDLFKGEKKPNVELEEQIELNRILRQALNNEFIFIQKLANSKDVAEWLNEYVEPEKIRKMLVSQALKINNFISKNALGLLESSTTLDFLGIDVDPDEVNEKMESVLEKYANSKSNEVQELFIVFAESVVANDVLRRFGFEAQQQCQKLNDLVKSSKAELEREKAIIQEEKEEFENKCRAQVQREVLKRLKLESIISNSSSNAKGSDKEDLIVKAREIMSQDEMEDDKDPEIYSIEEKEREIISLKDEIRSNEQKYKELKSKSEKTLSELNEYAEKLKKEKKDIESQYSKKVSELAKQVNDLEYKFSKVQEENATNLNKTAELSTENQNLLEKLKETADKYKQEYVNAKSSYESEIKKLKEQNEGLQIAFEQGKTITANEITKMRKQFKEKYENLNDQLRSVTRQSDAKNSVLDEMKQQLDNSQSTIDQLNEGREKLNQQIRTLQSSLKKIEIEKKIVDSKLHAKDESIKREKMMLETNKRMQALSQKSQYESMIETIKAENAAKEKNFYAKVVKVFKEFYDFKKQMTEETILELLQKVRDYINTQKLSGFTAQKALETIEKIHEFLGTPKNANVLTSVKELKARNESLDEKIQSMINDQKAKQNQRVISKQNASAKEWDDWARRIGQIATGRVCTMLRANEVRTIVEEAVLENTESTRNTRKCDMLRSEKKILLELSPMMKYGNHKTQMQRKCDLRCLVIICSAIKRIQKLSGHPTIALKLQKISNDQATKKNTADQSQVPLFSNFIVPSDDE